MRIHYNSRIVGAYFDDIYFRVMTNEVKYYKKQLFEMVNADICDEQMKKLRYQRRKESKKPSNKHRHPQNHRQTRNAKRTIENNFFIENK